MFPEVACRPPPVLLVSVCQAVLRTIRVLRMSTIDAPGQMVFLYLIDAVSLLLDVTSLCEAYQDVVFPRPDSIVGWPAVISTRFR